MPMKLYCYKRMEDFYNKHKIDGKFLHGLRYIRVPEHCKRDLSIVFTFVDGLNNATNQDDILEAAPWIEETFDWEPRFCLPKALILFSKEKLEEIRKLTQKLMLAGIDFSTYF